VPQRECAAARDRPPWRTVPHPFSDLKQFGRASRKNVRGLPFQTISNIDWVTVRYEISRMSDSILPKREIVKRKLLTPG